LDAFSDVDISFGIGGGSWKLVSSLSEELELETEEDEDESPSCNGMWYLSNTLIFQSSGKSFFHNVTFWPIWRLIWSPVDP
jgi:hypothetical protein